MITPLRPTNYASLSRHRLPRRRQRTAPPTAFSGTIFRLRPRLEVMEDRTLLSTFLVSNTGDSGPGSLRQAILDSNDAVGATNTIDFDISGSGVQTIAPLSSLPAITNPVLIDGTSQPGYGGTPLIELSGSQAGSGDGLTITGADVTVRGLDINNFSQGAGIHITGTGATGDWIYGNFLGTDPTGTQAEPNDAGVEIDGGATQQPRRDQRRRRERRAPSETCSAATCSPASGSPGKARMAMPSRATSSAPTSPAPSLSTTAPS